MNHQRGNSRYLPGIILPEGISVTTDLQAALQDVDYLVMAVPSQSLRENLERMKELLPAKTVLINTAKGLEVGTNLRMSQVVEQVIPGSTQRFVALYGPSHAEEVGRGLTGCGGILFVKSGHCGGCAGFVYVPVFAGVHQR